jgi:hypothetical protein
MPSHPLLPLLEIHRFYALHFSDSGQQFHVSARKFCPLPNDYPAVSGFAGKQAV